MRSPLVRLKEIRVALAQRFQCGDHLGEVRPHRRLARRGVAPLRSVKDRLVLIDQSVDRRGAGQAQVTHAHEFPADLGGFGRPFLPLNGAAV
jgi:hypothetical protein